MKVFPVIYSLVTLSCLSSSHCGLLLEQADAALPAPLNNIGTGFGVITVTISVTQTYHPVFTFPVFPSQHRPRAQTCRREQQEAAPPSVAGALARPNICLENQFQFDCVTTVKLCGVTKVKVL